MQATHCAPSAPASHRGDDVVARLRQSEIFRDYQDAFQTATGLDLSFEDGDHADEPTDGDAPTSV